MERQELYPLESHYFFFYGSLRRGGPNFKRYAYDALTIWEAKTLGELYHLPQGYPALLPSSTGYVYGEVMTFPDPRKTLERLDELEGYNEKDPEGSYYLRILKDVEILATGERLKAWCYVFPESRRKELEKTAIRLPTGYWDPTLF
jgi:gamma-glutamylcyclotransferase (GGCT)/AIG2-like uncharacterized protein YtfP